MCGIVGSFGLDQGRSALSSTLEFMTATLSHRGPDDSGTWCDADAQVGLGHRRLSIQDISSSGHQPMQSSGGRYQIVYNGEIYNFKSLRKELEKSGAKFGGNSDTEVLLSAIECWGLNNTIAKLNGMWAFALWDKKERQLFLCRDRIGKKPLYIAVLEKGILFGSELKVFSVYTKFKKQISRNSLSLFLKYNYIPAPYSIHESVYKLPAASIFAINLSSLQEIQSSKDISKYCSQYWSVKEKFEQGVRDQFSGSEDEALDKLHCLLESAVKDRMVSDVPLGAFLSGGIDSSIVVALMQQASSNQVSTFTIGFQEKEYNEADQARSVAKHLGTNHTELLVTPQEAMDVIPRLPVVYDEPFADVSQIPTLLVSELARTKVTVCLSGDGADEMFGGYNRYFWGQRIWDNSNSASQAISALVGKLVNNTPTRYWEYLFKAMRPVLPKYMRVDNPGRRFRQLLEVMQAKSPDELYVSLVSHWENPARIVKGSIEPRTIINNKNEWPDIENYVERMMFMDMVTYLPDDILVKLDRASMALGLEARVPFLDTRVIEFASSIPLSMKIKNNQGKWILRQLLHRYLPKKLIDQPKKGFGVPIGEWIRGPLRDWAESLLEKSRLEQEGYLEHGPIRKVWQEHLSGRSDHQQILWSVLMFESWLENQ